MKIAYADDPVAAEFERLVAKLDALRNGDDKGTILITSALTGEGKSTAASLVAKSVARNRRNPTLLIDFDIRRPRLHDLFNVTKEKGVVDILSNEPSLSDCFKQTDFANLFLITSGESASNPFEILRWDRIEVFINEAKKHFDNIIIDSAPVIPVSDPLRLAKFVDNVVMIVKAGATPRHIVKRAIDMLYDVQAEISGIVLNDMDNVLPIYCKSDYYDYEYFQN